MKLFYIWINNELSNVSVISNFIADSTKVISK
ncbi:hypothetical protein AAPFHON13_12210 [Apilactobacillus apinorum]|nr:hypothetical protein AAPFHON13_12210 [Apilactobacillus apinorum]